MNALSTVDHPRSVAGWRLILRFLAICGVALLGVLGAIPVLLFGLLTGGPKRARRLGSRLLVWILQLLGPTFVKFGQLASTRKDTMPPLLCEELSNLHDAVRPMSKRQRRRALRTANIAELTQVDAKPVASGSIACVYRGRLADGRVVAVKLKRPSIDDRMRADLTLVEGMVRLAQRMPKLRGMPLADLVGYMSRAILGQLDFSREARNIRKLRDSLSVVPQIHVPEVYPELSTDNCLLFEYLPELNANTPETLPAETRAELAGRALQAASRMMFVDGFVHCDLHPGNLYLTPDERVVILDAGYCVQLPPRVRDLIGEFFFALQAGNGRRCGEIVLESAVDPDRADRGRFVAEMTKVVSELAGPGNRFDMAAFGDAVFTLQQKHGIYAASDFAFPLMSLNVLDGTVRRLSSDVDFQRVGTPAEQ